MFKVLQVVVRSLIIRTNFIEDYNNKFKMNIVNQSYINVMLIREYNAQYKHDLASCLLKNKLVIRKKYLESVLCSTFSHDCYDVATLNKHVNCSQAALMGSTVIFNV